MNIGKNIRVDFEEDGIVINDFTGKAKVTLTGGNNMDIINNWQIKNYKRDIEHFKENPNEFGYSHKKYYEDVLKSIKNNKEPVVSGKEGIKSLEIIEAIYKSISLGGKEVEIKK